MVNDTVLFNVHMSCRMYSCYYTLIMNTVIMLWFVVYNIFVTIRKVLLCV